MSANVVPLRPAYGASPEAWAHFELLVGAADLLPVVSNPNAVISEQSTLKTLGKTPSVYNQNRRVAGLPGWSKKVSTPAEVERWSREPDYGICIQTRRVRALDIDVDDPALADAIGALAREFLGVGPAGLPVRWRPDTGKRLLAFECPGQLTKRSFKVDGGLVELLCDGQQFVAAGTHSSGSRYVWSDGWGVEGLPEAFGTVGQDRLEAAWAALVEQFALAPATEGEAGADRSRPDFEAEDAVADYLHDQGLVLSEQGEKLFVACPWKAGHTSDSGISETCWLRAGTRGFERGHFQCMHASCAARADEDFLDAVGFRVSAFRNLDEDRGIGLSDDATVPMQASVGPPDPFNIAGEWPRLKRDGNGRIEAVIGNVELALARPDMCKAILRFDLFRDELMVEWEDDRVVRPLTDADAVRLRVELEARGFKPIGRELMRDGLLLQARDNTFDSAQEWLAGLPAWDGVERVETSVSAFLAAADSPYTRAVGRYLWTALAGRVMDPGCKADMALVLQGAQGIRKSTAVAALAPDRSMFREVSLHALDADLSRKLRGCVVAEMAELRGLRGRESEAIKAWIAQQEERWVPKFHERETAFRRRCVLVGTSNPEDILDDETGERRWLPVACLGDLDVEGLVAARDQLWAEGLLMWRLGGVDWRDAEMLARYEHETFKVRDDWTVAIARWLDTPAFGTPAEMGVQSYHDRGWVTGLEVAQGALGVQTAQVSPALTKRVGKAMRGLGWRARGQRIDGKAIWAWVREG